jgi:hypothetical protein
MTEKKEEVVRRPGVRRAHEANGSIPKTRNGTPTNPEVMARSADVLGIEVDSSLGAQGLYDALQAYVTEYRNGHGVKEMADCEACGEESTFDTDCCPFCGAGNAPTETPQVKPAKESLPVPTPASKTKAKSTSIAKKNEKPAPVSTKPTDDIVTEEVLEAGQIENLKLLDDRSVRIRDLANDLRGNIYEIGVHIAAVKKDDLWKSKYKSFAEWISVETTLSTSYAYSVLEVVNQFDRNTFAEVGAAKLLPLLKIKDADKRSEVLEAAKDGASTRKVRDLAREASGRSAPEKEKKSVSLLRPANAITLIAKVNGKMTSHGFKSEAGRPLKAWKQGAFAEVALSEDVHMRIAPELDKEKNITGIRVAFSRVE